MKRKNIRWMPPLACAVLAVVLLLAGCSKTETPLAFADKVASANLGAEQAQVPLGIDEQELVKRLGKPIRTLNDGGRSFLFMYEDYQYASVDNEVVGYSLGPRSATGKGLKLGATKADVVKAYGESYYERGGSGPSATIGYLDKTNRLAMEFELKDDRVKAISVDSFKLYE
ncbi:hypothetical protein I8J29_15880 [Paenibacillus sp. MWE-103]|uniref:Beta-barrel assembly machine subunit BamE n=1 Tax=Paenibacillus artemisiicola TaxID=1172618 RepID=A0ABS3WC31_9BACL|nr:hypothetical protein [Paenibacillus artemisiicola]MBO7745691.1 hypothetical protein [Paenibacillus artemisiicola]